MINQFFNFMKKLAEERQRKTFDLTIVKYTIRWKSKFLAHKYNYKAGAILCLFRQQYNAVGHI